VRDANPVIAVGAELPSLDTLAFGLIVIAGLVARERGPHLRIQVVAICFAGIGRERCGCPGRKAERESGGCYECMTHV
jgi:hypothetical protein